LKKTAIPIITYGICSTSLSKSEINELSFAYDAAFVRIFGVKDANCIKYCQYCSGYLSFEHLYELCRLRFLLKLYSLELINKNVSSDLPDVAELWKLMNKYDVKLADFQLLLLNVKYGQTFNLS